jgi:hypothetical protein
MVHLCIKLTLLNLPNDDDVLYDEI